MCGHKGAALCLSAPLCVVLERRRRRLLDLASAALKSKRMLNFRELASIGCQLQLRGERSARPLNSTDSPDQRRIPIQWSWSRWRGGRRPPPPRASQRTPLLSTNRPPCSKSHWPASDCSRFAFERPSLYRPSTRSLALYASRVRICIPLACMLLCVCARARNKLALVRNKTQAHTSKALLSTPSLTALEFVCGPALKDNANSQCSRARE